MEEDYIDSLEQQLAKNRKTVEQRLNVVALQQELNKYKAKEKELREWCYKKGQELNATDILDILDKE